MRGEWNFDMTIFTSASRCPSLEPEWGKYLSANRLQNTDTLQKPTSPLRLHTRYSLCRSHKIIPRSPPQGTRNPASSTSILSLVCPNTPLLGLHGTVGAPHVHHTPQEMTQRRPPALLRVVGQTLWHADIFPADVDAVRNAAKLHLLLHLLCQAQIILPPPQLPRVRSVPADPFSYTTDSRF